MGVAKVDDLYIVRLVGTVSEERPKHFAKRPDARSFARRLVDDGTAERAEIYHASGDARELVEVISDHAKPQEIDRLTMKAWGELIATGDLNAISKFLGL